MNTRTLFLFLSALSSLSFPNFAQSANSALNTGSFPRTRLDVHQSLYSGEKGKSLAETSTANGAGISVLSNGQYFVSLFGFDFSNMSGRQIFLDNTAEVMTSFDYYSATTKLGFQIFPIPRRTRGMNVYLVGLGLLSYNFISLGKSATLTSIPRSDQSLAVGYAVGVGAEWILSDTSANKWALNAEASLRKESATLFKQNFDFSSMVLSVGLSW